MGRWRSKILFSLILYSAGFITAVYFLTPVSAQASPDSQAGELSGWSQNAHSAVGGNTSDSPAWAVSIRRGINTCVRFAEEYTLRAADLFRSKMEQGKSQSRQ
ncbi:MAG: hypothetical protein L0Y36_02310 [Planctomycetales bacterium]|nr:hypothetical protein [Planctomycetales bacterium]